VITQHDGAESADWPATLAATLSGRGVASAQAFEAIYGELSPSVASYLRMNAVADVDGLTNEVFLQVHQGLPRFAGDWPSFRSWVFTIAHHRMVDETRRAMRRPQVVPMDDLLDIPAGDVELDALNALSDASLLALLDELSDDQRAVLLLRIAADLSLGRVAEVLGKSLGAVKALQHRALANLRRSLSTEEAGT
jgi:RNA polymerase sigma-70 factor (ECF subfamily)